MRVLEAEDIDWEILSEERDAQIKVRSVGEFIDEAMKVIHPPANAPKFPKLEFANADVQFRGGEVTLWAGENGSGKSMLQGQVMCDIARQTKVCIASFEMKPAMTIARIARQMTNKFNPTRQEVSEWIKSVQDNFFVYDQQGTVEASKLLYVIRYCAEVFGIKHFAIDSLMKCLKNETDYDEQKRFVDELTALARDYQIHIHLVAHVRKYDSLEAPPTKMDIKGTGAITDLVDNILILWRNKKKEKLLRENAFQTPQDRDEWLLRPDAILICEKQRNGFWEGWTNLTFNKDTLRYAGEEAKIGNYN